VFCKNRQQDNEYRSEKEQAGKHGQEYKNCLVNCQSSLVYRSHDWRGNMYSGWMDDISSGLDIGIPENAPG
jgi:hypothetical protein